MQPKRGAKHYKWKGGVKVNDDGYLRISAGPLRGRYVHILVMEAKLGRPLTEFEEVDHIDNDRLNCHPDNLRVLTHSENFRKAVKRRWHDYRKQVPIFDDSKPVYSLD